MIILVIQGAGQPICTVPVLKPEAFRPAGRSQLGRKQLKTGVNRLIHSYPGQKRAGISLLHPVDDSVLYRAFTRNQANLKFGMILQQRIKNAVSAISPISAAVSKVCTRW